MKKTLFILLLITTSCAAIAANGKKDKFNYSYNFCVSNLNDCVTETPMSITINLTKDAETLYDMCTVKMDGKAISFRVISGIIRDKVHPNLSLVEMDGGIPTSKKWELKFIGDRAKLYRLGGIRYEFKNENFGEILGEANASEEGVMEE